MNHKPVVANQLLMPATGMKLKPYARNSSKISVEPITSLGELTVMVVLWVALRAGDTESERAARQKAVRTMRKC